MSAFRYLGATIISTDKETNEITAATAQFVSPAIMEYNYATTLYDVAKRYRKIKSVDDTACVMIIKINDDITLNKKSLLASIIKAKFSFADMLALSVTSTPVLDDTAYIESGLGMSDVEKIIPTWYAISSARTSVKIRKKDYLTTEAETG